ncbi:MAG TPA: hypothetical protein VK578_23190 [Edaphobacter sp.]|nr:hypothetical protein [Edaphobacter sp.]
MKSKKQIIGILLMLLATAVTRSFAQTNEMASLFSDFEARASSGTPRDVAEATQELERLTQVSRESVTEVLPVILKETSNPHLSVRRLAASALYQITTRLDGQALLSTETATFTALLTDTDIPIRRISILAVDTLRLNPSSSLVPVLETYLARQDAVSTIGAATATVLMKIAPNNVGSINAVVQFMKRQDHTSASREDLLNGIRYAKSNNREIGKEVARYADDPNEQTSVHAIETLQLMGKSTILDSQPSLSRIAADTSRAPSVRTAATKALSAVQ